MAQNEVTYLLNGTSVTARAAEVAGGAGAFAGGANLAASNAPGIGVATANGKSSLNDWTVLDQAGAARDPQDSQHIGGDGLGAGDATNTPINVDGGADLNDTVSLTVEATGWVKNAVA